MTRDGSVPGPIEPGRRCFVLPCVVGTAADAVALHHALEAAPLRRAVTFTESPTLNTSTFTTSPMLYDGSRPWRSPGSSSARSKHARRRRVPLLGVTDRGRARACPLRTSFALPDSAQRAAEPAAPPRTRPCLVRHREHGFGSRFDHRHRICCPCSLKIWVMPSLLPRIPIIACSS
jgi:hypothetical protein